MELMIVFVVLVTFQRVDLALEFFEQMRDFSALVENDLAGLCRDHASGRALEDRNAEFVLQILHRSGNGGSGDKQRVGGLGNAAVLADFQKIIDLIALQRMRPASSQVSGRHAWPAPAVPATILLACRNGVKYS